MTEVVSPVEALTARIERVDDAAADRLGQAGTVVPPEAAGFGPTTGTVGVSSVFASLVAEASTGGRSPESDVAAGVAVECLDRQGRVLAAVRGDALGESVDVSAGVLWSDWLHAQAMKALLDVDEPGDRVVSAARTAARSVESRNESLAVGEPDVLAPVSIPSGVRAEASVSLVVRPQGCSCATAARIGGLIGGAGEAALARAVEYGELVDEAVGAAVPRGASEWTGPESGPGRGSSSSGEPPVGREWSAKNPYPESAVWSAIWWVTRAVGRDLGR
jgi:hypothetical protein